MAERPTVHHLKARGAIGAIVSCRFCRHSAKLSFAQLRAGDDAVFAEVFEHSRMRCTSCQSDKFSFTVEWGPKPPGGLI
jgi:hypothetical protein